MIREFNFFHGFVRNLTLVPAPELVVDNIEDELTNLLSSEIAREIDNNIIEELARIAGNNGEMRFITNNVNVNYLEHYINMGGNRA